MERQPDRASQLAAQGADLYYVLSDAPNGEQERRFQRLNPDLRLVLQAPKPGGHSRFQLYHARLTSPTEDVWLDPPPLLGGSIALRGYSLSSHTVRPGETLRLVLYWESRARPARNYTAFNHLVGADGGIWAQQDGQPLNGQHPTSRWRPGETVGTRYDLVVRPEAAPGAYQLITGLYELQTLQRLPATGPGAVPAGHIVLQEITVLGP